MNELFVPIVGRPRKVATPQKLLDLFKGYVEDRMNRLLCFEEKESGQIGESGVKKTKTKVKHHPLSIGDFCVSLGNSRHWWNELPEEFLEVKRYIADWIFHYQLKGAESGEFNANIVARELGLADKKEVAASGDNINIIVKSPEEKDKIDNLGGLGI